MHYCSGAESASHGGRDQQLIEDCCEIIDVMLDVLDRSGGDPVAARRIHAAIKSVARVLDEEAR